MEFELKFYKLLKNKQYLTNNKIFFIYNSNNLNKKNWIIIEQVFSKLNLKYYRPYNKLTIKSLSNSIYSNMKQLIHGNIIFIKPKPKTSLKIKNLTNLNPILTLLCIKLNKKVYSITQIKNINTLNYKLVNLTLFKSLKNCLKTLSKISH
jgi:hypothetical protein